jgi:dimethylargininase
LNNAIVRLPARSVIAGLRAVDVGAPSYEGVLAEQRAYMRALETAGVAVSVLPALEAFPDSLFVEDAALVFTGAAILLAPGAATRRGETAALAPALRERFERVLAVERGSVDGGDVLATPRKMFIGRSARTDEEGAAALAEVMAKLGFDAEAVTTPRGVLHFKSDCSLLDDETVFATPRLAASGVFDGFRVLLTPDGEEAAANALRINERVLLSAGFPRSAAMLAEAGYDVVPLDTREIAKIDAGLSCMSLRWLS